MSSTPRVLLASLGLSLVAGLTACPTKRDDDGRSQSPGREPGPPPPAAASPDRGGQDADARESDHHVVFADRTSQAYLLLTTERGPAVTRESLAALVRASLPGAEAEPEAELLLDLVATEPQRSVADPSLDPAQRESIRHADLLGLHIEELPVAPAGGEPLISPEVLTDPILTRELRDEERAGLSARRSAVVLRAHYRNRFGVRGLRLLQTLVRLVAADRQALIHDPDTGETMNLAAFSRRRLKATVGNIADQVIVVPFPDPRHPEGAIRLATRGMRRFGSVDLELEGLPRDAPTLEAATHLVYGLAYRMVRAGEYDQEGYAVEVDDVVVVTRDDVTRAYAGRRGRLPPCGGCSGSVELHLVERPAEPHDPVDHVVARITAPRAVSEAASYDHPAWVGRALEDLLGVR